MQHSLQQTEYILTIFETTPVDSNMFIVHDGQFNVLNFDYTANNLFHDKFLHRFFKILDYVCNTYLTTRSRFINCNLVIVRWVCIVVYQQRYFG